jgi:hypothetical protein
VVGDGMVRRSIEKNRDHCLWPGCERLEKVQLGILNAKALPPSISIEIARIKDHDANPYANNTDT